MNVKWIFFSKNALCCLTDSQSSICKEALQYYKFRDGLPTLPSTECYRNQQIKIGVMLTDSPFSFSFFYFFFKKIYLTYLTVCFFHGLTMANYNAVQ